MDKLTICNMALSYIGDASIDALTEQTEPARRCVQFFEHDRRLLLRRFPWPFATRRVELVAVTGTPPDYKYQFRYPSGCLCIRTLYAVNDTDDTLIPLPDFNEYKILGDTTGRLIYANEPRVVAEYTLDYESYDNMDEQFIEVLAWKLASSIAFKLTGNPQIVQMATQEYERRYHEAIADATNEQNIETPILNTYAAARF